jgi:hypothetical protein
MNGELSYWLLYELAAGKSTQILPLALGSPRMEVRIEANDDRGVGFAVADP